jgi:voltage-gated potassium channel
VIDIFNGNQSFYTNNKHNFYYDQFGTNSFQSVTKLCYFAITTLATVGFGDFTPVSTQEKLIWSFVLIFGVIVYSFIMGNFIEILLAHNKLKIDGDTKGLT